MADKIYVVVSPAWGVTGAINHAFVYNYTLKEGVGLNVPNKDLSGVGHANHPRTAVSMSRGQWRALKKYPGWNKGTYIPFVNDCFSQLEGAFKYVGSTFPKDTKIQRLQPTRLFQGRYSYADRLRVMTAQLFSMNEAESSAMNKEAAAVIEKNARSGHKYKDRTGRLSSSIRSQPQSEGTSVYYDVDYAPYALDAANDEGMLRAVKASGPELEAIYNKYTEQTINRNIDKLDKEVEDIGEEMMYDQMNSILGVR